MQASASPAALRSPKYPIEKQLRIPFAIMKTPTFDVKSWNFAPLQADPAPTTVDQAKVQSGNWQFDTFRRQARVPERISFANSGVDHQ